MFSREEVEKAMAKVKFHKNLWNDKEDYELRGMRCSVNAVMVEVRKQAQSRLCTDKAFGKEVPVRDSSDWEIRELEVSREILQWCIKDTEKDLEEFKEFLAEHPKGGQVSDSDSDSLPDPEEGTSKGKKSAAVPKA